MSIQTKTESGRFRSHRDRQALVPLPDRRTILQEFRSSEEEIKGNSLYTVIDVVVIKVLVQAETTSK